MDNATKEEHVLANWSEFKHTKPAILTRTIAKQNPPHHPQVTLCFLVHPDRSLFEIQIKTDDILKAYMQIGMPKPSTKSLCRKLDS